MPELWGSRSSKPTSCGHSLMSLQPLRGPEPRGCLRGRDFPLGVLLLQEPGPGERTGMLWASSASGQGQDRQHSCGSFPSPPAPGGHAAPPGFTAAPPGGCDRAGEAPRAPHAPLTSPAGIWAPAQQQSASRSRRCSGGRRHRGIPGAQAAPSLLQTPLSCLAELTRRQFHRDLQNAKVIPTLQF